MIIPFPKTRTPSVGKTDGVGNLLSKTSHHSEGLTHEIHHHPCGFNRNASAAPFRQTPGAALGEVTTFHHVGEVAARVVARLPRPDDGGFDDAA